jgi:hypothetical protein
MGEQASVLTPLEVLIEKPGLVWRADTLVVQKTGNR